MILFPRVSSMSRIFLFLLFCLRFFSEILLFFLWFNFFKWYTREEDSSREEMTNEISYLLEMKRI